jgi:uncharacterized membrane protein
MKKNIVPIVLTTILVGIALISLAGPLSVSAEEFELKSPIEHKTFGALIGAIAGFLQGLAIIIAPIFIIFGAFYFITSNGDASKIKTGQRIILYTLIGFLIIFLAKAIVDLLIENVIQVK